MNERIARISDALLESYEDVGGINHLSGPNLPSRQGVEAIVADLESLLFPGFKAEEAVDQTSLTFTIGATVNRLIANLSTEITRSLCYSRRVHEGEHPCQYATSNAVVDNPADEHPAVGTHLRHKRPVFLCNKEAEHLAVRFLEQLPQIRKCLQLDVEAAFVGDPAAKSLEEVILSYPCIEAIAIYRCAHELWEMGIALIPRMMGELAHARTGIDIHPGATIGASFFIDHGTGVVIGETTVIGNKVKLYQGVTLGARSVKKEEADAKRHPTLEDEVTVYAGATILGGKTVVGKGSIIGGNVVLMRSVPAGSRVSNQDPELVIRNPSYESLDFHI